MYTQGHNNPIYFAVQIRVLKNFLCVARIY